MTSFAEEVKKSDGLYLEARGGSMMGDIQQIDFDFNTVKQLNLTEARKLYVNTVLKLINKLNIDQSVRPFLHNYPANVNNVAIRIGFYQPNGKYVQGNFVALISLIDGRVYYRSWDNGFKKMHSESFDEALKIVRGN